jgi:RND family efflux transporter MFP subunit
MLTLIRSTTNQAPCLRILLSIGAAALLSSCSGDDTGKKGGKAHLVEVAEVMQQPLEYTSDRAGSLRALREVKLFNQEEGRVVSVLAREGDRVRKGQPLVRLDARLLQAELDKAEAKQRQAQLNLQRLKRLVPQKLVSEDSLTRAETELDVARADARVLKTRVSYMTIRAPFAGEVADRRIEPGDVAPKHTHLMTLVDSTSLVTEVPVSELLLSRLQKNDRADVRIDALGKQVYAGKISSIYPTIDPATRLGQIEVSLSPVPQGARAGQFCRVTLHSQTSNPIVIPFSALRRDPEGEFVFVVGKDNKVIRQSIVSGLRLTDRLEVIDGLKPGQEVVKKGFLGLAVGDKVKRVNVDRQTGDTEHVKMKPADQSVSTIKDTSKKNTDTKTGLAADKEAAGTAGTK